MLKNRAMANKMLKAALWYRNEQDLGVIPIIAGKKTPCLTQWKPYQERKPSIEEIEQWWGRDYPNANIGIVTGKINNLTVIDLDKPEAKTEIEKHIPDSLLMPTVKTPKGQHLYFLYNPDIPNKANLFPGCDARNDGGYIIAPPSTNGAGHAYSFLVHLKNTALSKIPEALLIYILSYLKTRARVVPSTERGDSNNKQQIATVSNIIFKEGGRDEMMFHLANSLIRGGMPTGEVQQYCMFIAGNCKPPFPENEVLRKIESAFQRRGRSDITATESIRNWIAQQWSNISATMYQQDATISITPQDKHKIRTIFARLAKEGLLVRDENRAGYYRVIDKECLKLDWHNTSHHAIEDFRLPFGFEQFVEIYSSNLIVIAGSKDAGKTALLLNIARYNYKRHKIKYFSSEMDDSELNVRISKADDLDLDEFDRLVTFYNRDRNFADVLDPDAVNIIDYYEITDAFWNIAGEFAKIREKLNKGIAIIAIQKDRNMQLGRGASFSLEKPRVYMTVDNIFPDNVLKIISAKNRKENAPNPVGFERRFKIVQGINLRATDEGWNLPCVE
ncbi:MAG TPA: hypothetical protein ENH87_16615 [Pricia antarctica]|uniref:Bifunctional DNA primase/polymerase, N-terminal n=2 Tax=root TaxID=1 RepID=A0A831QSZ6_9FLAO|nr:hypothetical protein [Pricia antarctica]